MCKWHKPLCTLAAMTTAAERLQRYYEAEARTLQALRVRNGNRERLNHELLHIQKMIKELRAEVAAEQAGQAGRSAIGVMVADFSGRPA